MVNIQAKATDSSLTARMPNTQVMPSTGSNTIVAFTMALSDGKTTYSTYIHAKQILIEYFICTYLAVSTLEDFSLDIFDCLLL